MPSSPTMAVESGIPGILADQNPVADTTFKTMSTSANVANASSTANASTTAAATTLLPLSLTLANFSHIPDGRKWTRQFRPFFDDYQERVSVSGASQSSGMSAMSASRLARQQRLAAFRMASQTTDATPAELEARFSSMGGIGGAGGGGASGQRQRENYGMRNGAMTAFSQDPVRGLPSPFVKTGVIDGTGKKWDLIVVRVNSDSNGVDGLSNSTETEANSSFLAFENKCPHLGLSLDSGELMDIEDSGALQIRCRNHNKKFRLTGECQYSDKADRVSGNANSARPSDLTIDVGDKIGACTDDLTIRNRLDVFPVEVKDGELFVKMEIQPQDGTINKGGVGTFGGEAAATVTTPAIATPSATTPITRTGTLTGLDGAVSSVKKPKRTLMRQPAVDDSSTVDDASTSASRGVSSTSSASTYSAAIPSAIVGLHREETITEQAIAEQALPEKIEIPDPPPVRVRPKKKSLQSKYVSCPAPGEENPAWER